MLIVRDTRESGEMLEAALAAGVAAAGGHALLGGVLPTPGAALLVRRHGFDLAAVVSASHNPYQDNGIKFFGPDGTKSRTTTRRRIEAARRRRATAARAAPGRVRELHGAAGRLPARAGAALPRPRPVRDAGAARLRATAPRTRWRRRSSAAWAPTSRPSRSRPTGATSTTACGSTHVDALAERRRRGRLRRRLRLRRRRRPRARRRPQRRRGRRRRADRARRAAPARGRPAARRRRGRDRDDQLRLPHGHAGGGHRGGHDRPSATATCWPSCCSAAGRWAASSPATSSTPASCPRATASPPRCSRSRRWAARDLAERDAMEKLPQRLVNVPRRATATRSRQPTAVREAIDAESAELSRAAGGCWCAPRAPSRSSG